MSLKNLNVLNKTHRDLLNKLKDKRLSQIYKKFESSLKLNENFIVAVSGGQDSLALSFLAKFYSIKNSVLAKYIHVNHNLRQNSQLEAKLAKKILKKNSINLDILNWKGIKPSHNIQSVARNNRYRLLVSAAKKLEINNILTAHHLDDLYENFFIRIVRGSGLSGLVSLDKKTYYKGFILIRPLINFEKEDLIYITNKYFSSYVDDPSNDDNKFTRVRIRKLITNLKSEGLDKKKIFLTIKNLKYSNQTTKYYILKNLKENSFFFKQKNYIILKKNFFIQSREVVFRSLVEIIKLVGRKHYAVRGKKIDKIIDLTYNNISPSFKVTLGNCIIKKVNNSIIVSKEQ